MQNGPECMEHTDSGFCRKRWAHLLLLLILINNPHIGKPKARIGALGSLNYAKWTGSSWSIQTLDTGSIVYETSLALDSSGKPQYSILQLFQ